jgi:hypothetical protein
MSRNLRPVKVEWSKDFTSVFIDSDVFDSLVTTIFESLRRKAPKHKCGPDYTNDVYEFWAEDGAAFLRAIKDCKITKVTSMVPEEDKENVEFLLENMKNMLLSWSKFIGLNGEFRIWIDMY